MHLKYIWPILRELLSRRNILRTPEPMLMSGEEQVRQYIEFGRSDTPQHANYLYHSREISRVIQNCQTVVDLGCGPASQLIMVAQMNPGISFIGIDLSDTMLNYARETADAYKLKNVTFVRDDITALKSLKDHSVDSVISSLALHHLPEAKDLENCFAAISRVLNPVNRAIYLMDFNLLKSLKTIDFFLELNGKMPQILTDDYKFSLLSAFPLPLVKELARRYFPDCKVASTLALDFLSVIKTPSLPLNSHQKEFYKEKLALLSLSNQNICKDLGAFLRL